MVKFLLSNFKRTFHINNLQSILRQNDKTSNQYDSWGCPVPGQELDFDNLLWSLATWDSQ